MSATVPINYPLDNAKVAKDELIKEMILEEEEKLN